MGEPERTVHDIREAMSPQEIAEQFSRFWDIPLGTWDGFEGAMVGIGSRIEETHGLVHFVVYDANRMVKILVERDGMTHSEAQEYLEVNVFQAYIGTHTPAHIHTIGDLANDMDGEME